MTSRLDNFTDAAFAFAVTLLVIGGSAAPTSYAMLESAVAELPAFAIGFATISMFWFAHVRWRRYRGEGDWLSSLLTVLLIFLVLIYVQPLQAMARSLSTFLGGAGTPFAGDVGDLFFIYGAGFVAMAATMAALFLEARRHQELDATLRGVVRGEAMIWLILTVTGLVSIVLTRFEASEDFAPLALCDLAVHDRTVRVALRLGGGKGPRRMSDHRRSAPHVARNAAPIAEVLDDVLPERGLVLEVASGTGEHILHFAQAFPKLLWQPSDPEPAALRSIEAWRAEAGLFNLLPAVALDARAAEWPVEAADAILCINMVHISPWAATTGLLRGAGRLLAAGAPLYLYGAYRQDEVETAPSNEAFDASLRARDPEWGVRRLEDVVAEAEKHGLALDRVVAMPANNLSAVLRKLQLPSP